MKIKIKVNQFNYTVVSLKGYPFPIDMLRRDDSMPATEVDANKIVLTMYPEEKTTGMLVNLRYCGPLTRAGLTFARWQSFGWEIR